MIYADADYYTNEYGGKGSAEELDFKKASIHIDSLTFNRTCHFDELTEFQKHVIKESTCMMAEFEYENADLLENVLSGYSLNGASVSFGGVTASVVNGVCIRNDIFSYLKQCGLCTGVMI